MTRRLKYSILAALGFALCAAAAQTSCPPGGRRQSGAQNGEYLVSVYGYYSGSGKADIDATEVSIRVVVTGKDGTTQRLEIRDLQTEGPYFAGNGTIGSKPVRITGRLDAARSSRVTATFSDSDGHYGRIVGTLPEDAGNDHWLPAAN
jgi:hypothetical protein